jgi:hypothetical protein
MSGALERSLGKNASVTVEAAARSVDVDVETIRHWSHVGSLEIEQRGDMDVVRLDRVRILSDTSKVGARGARHGLLRALLLEGCSEDRDSQCRRASGARAREGRERLLTWDPLPPRYPSDRRR